MTIYQFADHILNRYGWCLPDAFFLRIKYWARMRNRLNLKAPKLFTEKIQWLKLYDRKPFYTTMVDKYEVKSWIAERIGQQYVIPTIGVWETPADIEWDKLPNQFVLKTTHGGGSMGVYVCKDKANININEVSKQLNTSLRQNVYKRYREWPYKNVKKRIIAEQFMFSTDANKNKELSDYKFFCFNGEPVFCQVIRDRHTHESIDFYDTNWKHMPFVGLNPNCINGKDPVEKPLKLDEMLSICRILSKDIPFLRVDLYDIDGEVYFGETTFYPGSGFGRFNPSCWDNILGDLLVLD